MRLWNCNGAHAALSTQELRERVHERMRQEQELVIDPAFFIALKQHLPQLRQVEIQPKRGWHRHELTQFRYDVILQVEGGGAAFHDPPWMAWSQVATLEALRQLLRDTEPEALGIAGVPNARLQAEVQILELLTRPDGPETAGELRKALERLRRWG